MWQEARLKRHCAHREGTLRGAARLLSRSALAHLAIERNAADLCSYPLCAAMPRDAAAALAARDGQLIDVSSAARRAGGARMVGARDALGCCSARCCDGMAALRAALPDSAPHLRAEPRTGALPVS